MDYAVVVYFDRDDDLYISQIMKDICHAGVNTYMLDLGIRPHVTLAMFKDTNPQEFSRWLHSYENYYLPGNWVPHCTLATKLSQSELHEALDVVIGDLNHLM